MNQNTIDELLLAALNEDAPWGDITGDYLIPAAATATAVLRARQGGVFAGGELFSRAFTLCDPAALSTVFVGDGARFEPGQVLAEVSGNARALLRAERIGLNFAQRLSAIATLTSQYIDAVSGTKARIADTRKTTPGLRQVERAAVRAGGGMNHRFSLSDVAMLKDNHMAVLTADGTPLSEALKTALNRLPHTTHVVVEVDDFSQIDAVIESGAATIMLDNFTITQLREAVAYIRAKSPNTQIEASGGVNLETVTEIAHTGVDVISVGALTHSAPAIDLGLDLVVSEHPDA